LKDKNELNPSNQPKTHIFSLKFSSHPALAMRALKLVSNILPGITRVKELSINDEFENLM